MKKEYYKVVSVSDNGIKRPAMHFRFGRDNPYNCMVRYAEGKWTKAPAGTRLFVFDNITAACKFMAEQFGYHGAPRAELWECSIRGRAIGWGANNSRSILSMWKIYNEAVRLKKKRDWKAWRRWILLSALKAVLAREVRLDKQIA